METTQITVNLNKQERNVNASVWEIGNETYLIVYGIALRTTQGNKTHSGYIWFKQQTQDHTYNIKEICNAGYSGMRGNSRGERSQFRYIGFFD